MSAWSPTDQQMWLRLRETTGILNMDGLRFYVERDLAAQRQALIAYERWKRSSYFVHLVEHRQPVSEAAALGLVVLLSVNLLGATIGQAVEAIRRRRWARV